jgi:hypothetical protein
MKLLIKLSFIISFLAITPSLIADTDKEIAEIKSRKFIIAIEPEWETVLKVLKNDPIKLAEYKKSVADFNIFFKKHIEKFWKFHTKFECKTYDEIAEIRKDESLAENYVYISCSKFKLDALDREVRLPYFYEGFDEEGFKSPSGSFLRLVFLEKEFKNHSGKSREYVGLTGQSSPNEADIILGVKRLVEQIEMLASGLSMKKYKLDVAKRGISLKGKTLLLDEKLTDKNIKTEGFPFKVKIVSKEEIDKAIINEDPNYACMIIPSGYVVVYGYVNSEIVLTKTPITLAVSFFKDTSIRVNNEHLDAWAKQVE